MSGFLTDTMEMSARVSNDVAGNLNETFVEGIGNRVTGKHYRMPDNSQVDTSDVTARSGTERMIDNALDFYESGAVQDALMVAPVVMASFAGVAAMGTAAAAVGVGFVASGITAAISEAVAVEVLSLLGFQRLAGDAENPAVVGDPIAHIMVKLKVGAMILGALAAVAVGLLILGSAGTLTPLVVVAAAAVGGAVGGLGAGIASAAGQFGENKGVISQGSPNVMFEGAPVARMRDLVACSDHGGPQKLAEGAETVFANNQPIVRIGHRTTCDGKVNAGRTSIAITLATGANRLDINGGGWMRAARITEAVTDLLPIPRKPKPRPNTTNNAGGNTPRPDGTPDSGTPVAPKGEDGGNTRPRPSGSDDGPPNSQKTTAADPVDVATGRIVEYRTDIDIPGTIALRFMRNWQHGQAGILGPGWATTWCQYLELGPDSVIFRNEEGQRILFHAPDREVRAQNLRYPLLELGGARDGVMWIFDEGSQHFLVFGPARAVQGDTVRLRLTRIEDRNGNRISLTWGEEGLRHVAHSDGFALGIHSEGGLMLRAVLEATDVSDCGFVWSYSRAGLMTEAVSAQTGTTRYRHDAAGRLTGWSDRSQTHSHYEYDAQGRVVRNWSDSGHMGGELAYDTAARRTTVTDRMGAVTVYDWTDQGVVWRKTDPNGGVWLTEWDRDYHVLSRTDPLGNRTAYDYDDKGRLIATTDPAGAVSARSYTAGGLLASETDAAGSTTHYRYDPRGNLAAIEDASGTTIMRRGDKGQLTRIDRPDGRQSRIYYDALMRPTREQDAAGAETHLRYDTEGRLVWQLDPDGGVTRYDVTRGPDNPLGRARQITEPGGRVTRVIRDAEGQVATIIAPDGTREDFAHGAFDVMTARMDGLGHRLTLEHDSELRLSAIVNENGERHELMRDRAGHLLAERDAAGVLTRYGVDAAGRRIARLTADGVETRYSYTPAGHLATVEVVGHPEQSIHYDYDPAGRVISARMGDTLVELRHDSHGHLTAETVNGRAILSEYHGAGPARIARHGDVLALDFAFSDAGYLEGLDIDGAEALSFSHDLGGHELLRSAPEGFALAQGWDAAGNLVAQLAGPRHLLPEAARVGALAGTMPGTIPHAMLAARHYRHDAQGRATAIEDRAQGDMLLSYDARGQVVATRRIGPDGADAVCHFSYDPARILSRIEDSAAGVEVVTAQGGRVQQRGAVAYRHDACGRVVEKRVTGADGHARIWLMGWDAHGRLTQLTTPEGAVWRYGYDAFGRRLRRERLDDTGAPLRPAEGSAFQWDGDQLVAEAPLDTAGVPDWDRAVHWVYHPDGFTPLARVEGGAAHYVIPDHLGTPRELISADGGRLGWRGAPSLWGASTGGEGALDCPIRFQGQWADAESGLYYNRFRYYDPDATQYLTPDPIGLSGGVRLQGYVTDPNSLVDPLGLQACPVQPRTQDGDAGNAARPRRADQSGEGAPVAPKPKDTSAPKPDDARSRDNTPAGRPRYTQNADGSLTGPRGGQYTPVGRDANGNQVYRDRSGKHYTFDGDKRSSAQNPNPRRDSAIRDHNAHHQRYVDDLSNQLRNDGYTVVNEVTFTDTSGNVISKADIVALRPGSLPKPDNIVTHEVKTGDAGLSPSQQVVYPEIISGEAIPTGRKLDQLGLEPGVPLKEQGYPNGISVYTIRTPGLGR